MDGLYMAQAKRITELTNEVKRLQIECESLRTFRKWQIFEKTIKENEMLQDAFQDFMKFFNLVVDDIDEIERKIG